MPSADMPPRSSEPSAEDRTDNAIRSLIEGHESSLSKDRRRRSGVHYTPQPLAEWLSSLAIEEVRSRLGRLPLSVCDTTCGAGSFLVAVADQLARRGLEPVDIVGERITGFDIDPEAVRVAREALIRWAEAKVGRPLHDLEPQVRVADALDELPTNRSSFELVIGNPPFLTQLRSKTALGGARLRALSERLGGLGPYVDVSAILLLLASKLTAPGGVTCMIQPQSFLSVSNSRPIREQLSRTCAVSSIFSSDQNFFDAAVRVCAVVVSPQREAGEAGTVADTDMTRVYWAGRPSAVTPTGTIETYCRPLPPHGQSWGRLLGPALGIPEVPEPEPGLRLRDVANTTAGFRDEYYALRECTFEAETAAQEPTGAQDERTTRLTTVGMIRPLSTTWGERTARIGGRKWVHPAVDLGALEHANSRVSAWTRARLVPKVLVATQTAVVEAVADPVGEMVPMTPVISVEPRSGWRERINSAAVAAVDLHWLAAALSAPSLSAQVLAENLGSGLSSQSVRWSARSVGDVALPTDLDEWAAAAAVARALSVASDAQRPALLADLGRRMCAAYGLGQRDDIYEWWLQKALRA